MNPVLVGLLCVPACVLRHFAFCSATFQRVPPGHAASVRSVADDAAASAEQRPLVFSVASSDGDAASAAPLVEYECDYVILATGGELSPVSDDRQLGDGSIKARRARLRAQIDAVMTNCTSALVVGGGLTGTELAAELAERLGPGRVTLAVGPTLPARGAYPGDPGAGLLPGFRDTCGQKKNLGRGGATRYVRQWFKKYDVKLVEAWAVPPPKGATLNDITAAAAPSCARSWRVASDDVADDSSWAAAGPEADLPADAVFDCRGLRPNTRESYTRQVDGAAALGVPRDCVAPSGWLRVDERFRLSERPEPIAKPTLQLERSPTARILDNVASFGGGARADGLKPTYDGRVYCVGDAAEKDKQERTAANAHAEGEYAAMDILRAVDKRPPMEPFVKPLRLCAISLGRWDGVVVLGKWVALRGWLAAIAKALIQIYFVNFLPLPYAVMRRMPGRTPRRYGGSGGLETSQMVARSGAAGLVRSTTGVWSTAEKKRVAAA